MGASESPPDIADASYADWQRARAAYAAATGAGPAAAGGEGDGPARPRADLCTLVATLGAQAMLHLGVVPHPLTRHVRKDLAQARYTIDLLSVLEDKTRGNRTAEEDRVIRSLLTDLCTRYVRAS